MARPKYSLPDLRKKFEKTRSVIVRKIGCTLDGEVVQYLSRCIANMVTFPREVDLIFPEDIEHEISEEPVVSALLQSRYEAAYSCFRPFSGKELTSKRVTELSVLVSTWWDKLRKGTQYTRWDPNRPVWALLHVEDVRLIAYTDSPRFVVTFSCEGGPAVLCRWSSVYSSGYLKILMKEIGFPKYKKFHAVDIMDAWFVAVLQNEKGRLVLSEYQTDSSQLTHNRSLYKRRMGPCTGPLRELTEQCGICRYGKDECLLGRWAVTYTEKRMCVNGHIGSFRPDVEEENCLACLRTGKARIIKHV